VRRDDILHPLRGGQAHQSRPSTTTHSQYQGGRSIRFRARKTFRFGPFYMTLTQSGGRSFGIKLGPISHNTRRTTSIDTPGPGGFHHQHSRRSER
jgi:hypothetical protein